MLANFETPAFVVDGDALVARASMLARAVDGCRFSYSVKTLPVPEAVLLAREAGWLVEVVSREEYEFACGLGISAGEIILNGPSKDDELLRTALDYGAIVHADSEEELRRAAALRASTASGRLGVRLGLGITDPRWARFGIDASDEGATVRLLAEACGGWSLSGFHVHSGSNRTSVEEFLAISARAIDFARAYVRYTGADIEWIDLGGGFADAAVTPHASSVWNPPEIEQFARKAVSLVRDWTGRPPVLMFEPGRALMGPCVDLYTRVETVKNVAGVQVATIDAGINSLPFARAFVYPVELCDETFGQPGETVLSGPLCTADDVLRHDVMLPPLTKGTLLRIRGVGGYNVSMSFDFIRPRASVFVVRRKRMAKTRSMFS